MDINQTILVGRLADDVRYKEAVGDTSSRVVARLIVNRPPSQDGKKRYDAIQIVAWGTQADNLARYTTKGKELAIVGEIRVNSVAPQKKGDAWKNYTEVLVRSVSYGRDSNQAKFMKAIQGGADAAAQATALQNMAGGVDFTQLFAANPQLLDGLKAVVQGAQPTTSAQSETASDGDTTTDPTTAPAEAVEIVPEDSDSPDVQETDNDDAIHENNGPFNDAD